MGGAEFYDIYALYLRELEFQLVFLIGQIRYANDPMTIDEMVVDTTVKIQQQQMTLFH